MNVAVSRHFSAEQAAITVTSRLREVVDHLIRLLTETSTTLAEFVSSTTLLYTGLLMVANPDSFIQESVIYREMMLLMSARAWGALFIAIGGFQSIANLRGDRRLRRIAAGTAAFLFAYVGALGLHQHPVSIFGALCKVHALGQVLVFLHLGLYGSSGAR